MTPATQRQLPGGRTSAQVPKGTSPTEAARAAREATTNPKAPSAQGGKGGGKAGKTAAALGDYDTAPPTGGAGGEGGTGGLELGYAAIAGDGDDAFDAAMQQAMKEVKDKHMPENITAPTDERGRAMMPGGEGSLVNKFRAVFSRDVRPDVPLESLPAGEQDKRAAYMIESQRVAETMRAGGRVRDSHGRFAKSITITTHGAVQVRGADGRIREVVRSPYREAERGRVVGNIETPIASSPAKLTEAVDRRLKAYGESLFQDRAGLTPRRLAAMRLAFALDRKERGWAIPDWGLVL